ncbi:MAG TPA: bifunctional transaldolase/phosoglucose isomerase [Candidatus Dormibacteraeota bacterium]|nr:bifunctional transaldolase/phosoglucose isomerase [Candidatus Dormibacteraeota bacterium]
MAASTPIQELRAEGQSLWLDNIRRQLISSGELRRLREEGVTGVTSNPTIFEKAVAGSTDYDEALVRMVRQGRQAEEILWDLMVEDIQAAADVFRPVYDETKGGDGYVSIEVSPTLGYDTEGTIAMARDLFKRAGRPNVMVKIPGTEAGLPAIRKALGEGININVTLIFSVDRYDEVVEAFLSGLEDFHDQGGDLGRVASVASFFVSRVDTKVNKLLDARVATTQGEEQARLQALVGKAAIANSKVAYEHFGRLHSGSRWEHLAGHGAHAQRCLWASTSTKDPRFPDTYYVEELIGPQTVDTVPPATLAAFREHGEARRTLDAAVDGAEHTLRELKDVGIDLDDITKQLEKEGVDSFAESFKSLIGTLSAAAKAVEEGKGPRQWYALGELQPAVDAAVEELDKAQAPRRIWAKDATFWPHADHPENWLGWLNVPEKMLEQVGQLLERAKTAGGFRDVVLMGMGGSSLCPDVLRNTFGTVPEHPRLHVLDTTDPQTIAALRARLDVEHTLFIASSKSGGTTETLSHLAYFWEEALNNPKREGNFAVVTDPGSSLEELAAERDFRWIWENPTDIGGRYSALSYFGLVPGAMMGVDVKELLERAEEMASACDAAVDTEKNPGVWLGAALGALAKQGRNKVTLITSPKVATLGYWIEQLIAESTGKNGTGILPVEGEPLGDPAAYGEDRVFVHTRLQDDGDNEAVRALEKAGQPVITLTLRDTLDLGGEFLRWEIAIAAAGSVLGIDPFNQPNVQESKDNTKRVLHGFAESGKLPEAETLSVGEAGTHLARALGARKDGAYFTVQAYTTRDETSEKAIARIRTAVRGATKIATTAGYGPRFLHSTGQFHKGGPRVGIFLQIVEEDSTDVQVPGEPYGFSTLKQAQALGDLEALQSRELPVIRVSIGKETAAGWEQLAAGIEAALRP